MSRKPRIDTSGAPPLSTNPFAALEGALGALAPAPLAEPSPEPQPAAVEASPPGLRGKIIVRREKKGRGGKTATVVEGLDVPSDALETMAQQLRRSLGCGAHVEGTSLVLTGAQSERVRDWLTAQGAARVVLGN